MTTSHAETAITYAQQYGWAVHPVDTKKQPVSKHGRNDATRDDATIRQYFKNGAQIGVATGPESGLFVLDVDLDEPRGINGYETLEYLESIHGPLPMTPHQRTGRGGMQYFFCYQEGLKNSAGKIGAGIDTRGQGGYVVVAPSHNTNGPYEWVVSPADAPLADVPTWLVEALKEAEKAQPSTTTPLGDERQYCLKMLGQAVARVATASDGQKHDTLLKMARWLGGFVPMLNETEIESALFAAIELRAEDHQNARKTIQDGIAYGRSAPLTVPPLRQQTKPASGKPEYVMAEPSEMPESALIMERLKLLGWSFRLNICTDTVEVNGIALSDILKAEIRVALRDVGLAKKLAAAEDAYVALAKKNSYHPVQDYLNSLKWDKEDHIGMLADCLHSSDPPIVYRDGSSMSLPHVYLYRWLVGAVAKVFTGSQNPMFVLDGGQGIGKSTLAHWLCPLVGFFLEGPINVADKDSDIRLISQWIWEVSELDATTRKADQSALKSFITKEVVTVRKAYGAHDIKKPAMASLIGTVNNTSGFLADETGSRRFMITKLDRIDRAYQLLDRDQVWAQAMAMYRDGETARLTDEESTMQRQVNESYQVETLLTDWIARAFEFNRTHDTPYSLAEIVSAMEYDGVKLSGSEKSQTIELSRVLIQLGARKNHTRQGNRWIGLRMKPRA